MDEWIANKIEEDQEREYELERFLAGIPTFLHVLTKRVRHTLDTYAERFPEKKIIMQEVKLGLLVTWRGRNAVKFQVVPETRMLQCGPVNEGAGKAADVPLTIDEGGQIDLEDKNWDSLLKGFLAILFPNP